MMPASKRSSLSVAFVCRRAHLLLLLYDTQATITKPSKPAYTSGVQTTRSWTITFDNQRNVVLPPATVCMQPQPS